MIKKDYVLTWLAEIRANFLVLSVALVMVGGAAAWHDGVFHLFSFCVTVVGVVCAHISVNLFNEYSDWHTGIDEKTNRTSFSGGSGILQKGLLKPGQVKAVAWMTLSSAFLAGLWLAWVAGWPVVVLMAAGGITIVTYTDFLTKWMLGELASGLTLGSFVVIGSYYVQTGSINSGIIWASIPPGLLTMLLLLLNEFPDAEADSAGGRRHIVIVLGRHSAAYVYSLLLLMVYIVLAGGVVIGSIPVTMLIGLVTFPLAAGAAWRTIQYAESTDMLIPALGMNVIVVLATDFLMALGFILA